MKRRLPDPLDPDQTGAGAQPDTFQQCANPGCSCKPNAAEPLPREDIE